jgi:hypothetical protein
MLMIPQAAQAACVVQPFDQVVRQSDSVLVGTVIDGRARGNHRTGIIIRIDVDEVLKGSAEEGQRVAVSSCEPVIIGSGAEAMAQGMIGQRQLFLLQKGGSGVAYEYGGMLSPLGMTLNEQITRGESRARSDSSDDPAFASAMPTVPPQFQGVESDSLSRVWVVAGVGLVALVLVILAVLPRSAPLRSESSRAAQRPAALPGRALLRQMVA